MACLHLQLEVDPVLWEQEEVAFLKNYITLLICKSVRV